MLSRDFHTEHILFAKAANIIKCLKLLWIGEADESGRFDDEHSDPIDSDSLWPKGFCHVTNHSVKGGFLNAAEMISWNRSLGARRGERDDCRIAALFKKREKLDGQVWQTKNVSVKTRVESSFYFSNVKAFKRINDVTSLP